MINIVEVTEKLLQDEPCLQFDLFISQIWGILYQYSFKGVPQQFSLLFDFAPICSQDTNFYINYISLYHNTLYKQPYSCTKNSHIHHIFSHQQCPITSPKTNTIPPSMKSHQRFKAHTGKHSFGTCTYRRICVSRGRVGQVGIPVNQKWNMMLVLPRVSLWKQ